MAPAVSSPKTSPPKVPAVEPKAETGPAKKTAFPGPAGVPAQATASVQAGVLAQAGVPAQAGTSAQPAVPAQEGSASTGPTSPASTAVPKSVWGTRSFADVVRNS